MESNPGFDANTTVRWVSGVLQDPQGTAEAYRETEPTWQRTFMQITLPCYVASAVVGFVLSLVFHRAFVFGGLARTPFYFLVSLAWSIAFMFVLAFIFDFLAGVFKGQRHYDRAFAALSLAVVPALAGGVLSPLPWIGWLIGLAAGIYSLVLTYRFIPVFMTVPEDKRVVHYVASLVTALIVNIVVAGMLAAVFAPAAHVMPGVSNTSGSGSGLFGDLERPADFADQASQDTYDPPKDGMLTDAQVATYARDLQRTAELRDRLGKRFDKKGDGSDDSPSVSDIFSGVKDAVRIGTAEMEVVKTSGGNWAEHQWVKNQIETARVQKDSSPAVKHNYALFQQYQGQIEKYESLEGALWERPPGRDALSHRDQEVAPTAIATGRSLPQARTAGSRPR